MQCSHLPWLSTAWRDRAVQERLGRDHSQSDACEAVGHFLMPSVSEPLSVVVPTLKTVTDLRGVVWEGESLGSGFGCAVNRQIGGKPQSLPQCTSASSSVAWVCCPGNFSGSLPLAHRVNSNPSHTFPWNGTCGTCASTFPRAPEAAEALVREEGLATLSTGRLPSTGAEVGAGFKPQPPLSAL